MTCIVGLVENGKVYIGGDSAGICRDSKTIRKDPKVFKKDEFVFGFTDSFRMGQLLRYKFNPPAHKEGQDLMEYMVVDFVESLRNSLKEGGFAYRQEEQEYGGTFLVGIKGRLFTIERDYQVAESGLNFTAIGCGSELAKGAMYVQEVGFNNDPPEKKIEMSLIAATIFNTGVSAPYIIESV